MAAIQSTLDAQRLVEQKGLLEALFYVGLQAGVSSDTEYSLWVEVKQAIIKKHK